MLVLLVNSQFIIIVSRLSSRHSLNFIGIKVFTILLAMFGLDMLLQITSSRERSFATTASIRSVIRVDMQMKFQIGQLIKSFITQSTVVGLFARMNEEMVSKITFLMKSFSADITNKFLLFAVRAYVGLQSRATVERFLTNVAFVWLVTRVNDLMSTESAGQTETLTTDITDKRTSTCMAGHFEMNRQRVFCFECFPALFASVNRFHSGASGWNLSRFRRLY